MDPKTKVALRYVWQAAMGLVGVLFIVLGAMRVTKNPDVDNGAIILGVTAIAITIYLMARGIPRFPDAGEPEIRGAMSAVDTLVPIGLFVVGVAVIFIVGAAV